MYKLTQPDYIIDPTGQPSSARKLVRAVNARRFDCVLYTNIYYIQVPHYQTSFPPFAMSHISSAARLEPLAFRAHSQPADGSKEAYTPTPQLPIRGGQGGTHIVNC